MPNRDARTTPFTAACATFSSHGVAALSRVERDAWDALPTDRRRADWLAGRVAAKRAAGRRLAIGDHRRITIASTSGAAPQCIDHRSRPLPVSLSIAHAGACAIAVAAERGDRIGVDLEHCGAVRASHVRLFCGRAERRRSRRLDPTLRWVLKEAAWKAFGCTPALPLNALELWFDARGALCAVEIDGARHGAQARLSHPWPRFVAAVVHAPAEVS